MKSIIDRLYELQDFNYRDFQYKIIGNKNVNIIGCRIPDLRKFAKELIKENNYKDFLNDMPYKTYDEYILCGLIIGYLNISVDELIVYLDKFVQYIDNWAVCDISSASCKLFKKDTNKCYDFVIKHIKSDNCWIVRFAIVLSLNFLIKTEYVYKISDEILKLKHDKYYVNMSIAWFYATFAIYDFDYVYNILVDKKLDDFTSNKIIQKMCESYRITDEQKLKIRKLRNER